MNVNLVVQDTAPLMDKLEKEVEFGAEERALVCIITSISL